MRTVFFVKDAERALSFYRDVLGFTVEWTHEDQGRLIVFQVSLFSYQLILNQTVAETENRAGHGRGFIGIDSDMVEPFRQHLADNAIKPAVTYWGAPTLAIRDLDENEIFIWLPESEWPSLEEYSAGG